MGALQRALTAAIFAIVTMAVVPLTPSPAAAETTLEVTTPADGRFQSGGPTPLIVTIAADGAVAGTLTATFEGRPVGSQRVDVPGGSAKDIVFIVDIPPWAGGGNVSFDADGDESGDASTRINLIAAGGDELVAVLPELAARDLPATADVATDIGVARLFPFDVELLDAGAGVLAPFNQVVVTRGDLEALDGPRLDVIEGWVGSDGGLLVVDEEPGTTLPIDLGDATELSSDTIGYGLGTIRFSGGAASDGGYDGLLRATPSRSFDEFPWGGGFGGGFGSTTILATDAGVRVPAIGSLILALLVYTAVVGPILWFALRRARREPLLWLVLPGVALVTTAGVYLAGQALRDDTSTAHATLYADLPTQRLVDTRILVTAPNGGVTGVRLDDGWVPTQLPNEEEFFFDGPFAPGGGGESSSDQVLIGDDLAIDLPPGGIGVVAARRAEDPVAPSWGFDFEADGANLVGSVTNLTTYDLEEVFVVSGQGFTRIRDVAAGASADVTLRNVQQPPLNGDPLMERLFQFDGFSGDRDGVVNPSLLIDWLNDRPQLRAPGFVTIVGWTRDQSGPLTTSRGGEVEAGRTAFLTADRVATGSTADAVNTIEFLRGWNSTRVADPVDFNQCADFPATLRLTNGGELDDPALALSTRAIVGLDVWDGTSWLPAGMGNAPRGDLLIDLPAGAFDEGSIHLRVQMSCDFWGMQNPFPTIVSPEAGDDVLTIGELGDGEPTTSTTGPPTTQGPDGTATTQPDQPQATATTTVATTGAG